MKKAAELMNPRLALGCLAGFTVARATNYLIYTFDACYVEVIYNGQALTLIELASLLFGCEPANNVKIIFWGGPADAENWYHGTLLTLLVDHFLYHTAEGHEIADDFLRLIRLDNNPEDAILEV